MKSAYPHTPLPEASLQRLASVDAVLPILTFLACSGHGSAARGSVENMLAPLYPDRAAIREAIAALDARGFISLSRAGRCRLTERGRSFAEQTTGRLLGLAWPDVRTRILAALALGLDPRSQAIRDHLARKDNLECAALARLHDLAPAGGLPQRSQTRLALLRAIVAARLPECEPALTEITMHNISRDATARAIMLGAAGRKRGTMRDAEIALLRKSLGLRPEAKGGVAEALIRASLNKGPARAQAQPKPDITVEKQDLVGFAASVRDLAKTLRTDPFAGRVAIAQVYDAGVIRGRDFGSLDEFKARVAEAGRAGLLDLERYDIAGPMDHALKERSRVAFGRDERHFIVNEWI